MTEKMMVKELAEKVGMEKDLLLLRIKKMGVAVENEDSFLEGENLLKVEKEVVSAKDVVEERIKPTLIRRRARPKPEVKVPQVSVTTPAEDQKIIEKVEERESKKDQEAPEKEEIKEASTVSPRKAVKMQTPGMDEQVKLPKVIKKREEEKPQKNILREVKITPGERFEKRKGAEKKWDRGRGRGTPRRAGEKFSRSRPKAVKRPTLQTEITVPKASKRIVKMAEIISVSDLAKRMGVKANEIIKKLMELGVIATINKMIDFDSATLVAGEFGFEVESADLSEVDILEEKIDAEEDLCQKSPVVTVMGHVDHGKTSLLDTIRKTNVTGGEAGGITQHIGAYHVHLDKGDITFIDTPGHEAFTEMRARGSRITDIVVLVVAADDGVMPQTIEAINHAKAANVPIIVAINKMDLPDADPEKIKQVLTEYELVSEEWGGNTIFAEVSAKNNTGVKELLELILLQAEILECKANPNKSAVGVVIESRLDKGRGPICTVLVRNGTLKTGVSFVTGIHFGKVRAMISDWGDKISEAGPSMPVEILGLPGVPDAGDSFIVVKDDATAKQIAEIRLVRRRESELAKSSKVSLTELYDKMKRGDVKELNIIIKGDVHGSVEVAIDSLEKLGTEAAKVKIIHSGVGGVSEGDVMLASASNAVIIGFNVRAESKAQEMAEREGVDIRFYSIIYDLTDEIRKAMEGLLDPTLVEEVLGSLEVRQVFTVPKIGTIAGSYVSKGKVARGNLVRLLRDSVVICEGKLSSLRRFKDDVKEVASGYECGVGIENYNDIKVGDIIEIYRIKEVATKL